MVENNKPFIIVTADYDYNKDISLIKNLYCEALAETGGVPVLLPLSMNDDLIDVYIDKCDGLMVTGGPDVDAEYYGERNLPFNGELSPYRDAMELSLIKKAVSKGKPVLGICRGMQIMNAAMGGTLYQDIHEQIKDRQLIKHSQNAPRWHATHEVTIKKGSFMWEVFKAERVSVNSFHHQAVKDIALDFEGTACSDDGIVEAIEYRKSSFAVGVQWHPEDLYKKSDLQRGLFRKFIDICMERI